MQFRRYRALGVGLSAVASIAFIVQKEHWFSFCKYALLWVPKPYLALINAFGGIIRAIIDLRSYDRDFAHILRAREQWFTQFEMCPQLGMVPAGDVLR